MSKQSESVQTLHIRNMVCNRCIRVVREELEKIGIAVQHIILGEVTISSQTVDMERIRTVLQENGFELIDNRKGKIIEAIKQIIITHVHYEGTEERLHTNLSTLLTDKMGLDYHYMSTLFSSVEQMTIERYTILQKIERVKELLKYNELSLSEIAWRLGYSSTAHLSNQFKSVTGISASEYKKLQHARRIPLDQVRQ